MRGELPCVQLFENEHTLAFMDLMPQSDGHCLVISKEPAETLLDVSPQGAAECIRSTQRLAQAVTTALQVPGVRVMQFSGRAAGQTVPHLHFHIIPARSGENMRMHGAQSVPTAELELIAARIRAALAK
jgi:histidine triad (HIT) family protein